MFFIFIILTVLFLNVSAFAEVNFSCQAAFEANGVPSYYNVTNFSNLSETVPDNDVKVYAYALDNADISSDYSFVTLVSNVPFEATVSYTVGSSTSSETYQFDAQATASSNAYLVRYVNGLEDSTIAGGALQGYYVLGLLSPLQGNITSFSNCNLYSGDDSFAATMYKSYLSSSAGYSAVLAADFFELPPLMTHQMGGTKIITMIILLMMGIVIFWIACKTSLNLFKRYFQRLGIF